MGEMKEGWTYPNLKCKIALMNEGVFNGINSFTTIGLSDYSLNSRVSDMKIFQELFILMPFEYGNRNISSVLYISIYTSRMQIRAIF